MKPFLFRSVAADTSEVVHKSTTALESAKSRSRFYRIIYHPPRHLRLYTGFTLSTSISSSIYDKLLTLV